MPSAMKWQSRKLRQKIAVVRTSGPSVARADAAESIADLTTKLDPDRLDDKTVSGLVSLLNTDDDSVRYWVAISLGHIGARAQKAVPSLLRILAEVQCQRASKTSEGGVRYALKQMGVTPPLSNCER